MVNPTPHPTAAKILVVDHDQAERSVLSRQLSRAGYSVFEAADASVAFSFARRVRPDLIVLDIFFPPDAGQSGNSWTAFMIVDWFRRMGVIENTPVIIVSGAGLEQLRDRCPTGGVEAFLARPVDTRELLAAVRRLLDDRRGPTTAEPRVATAS